MSLDMFNQEHKPANLPEPISGGSVFQSEENPAQIAEREEREKKQELAELTARAAAEADRLKKAQENVRRIDSERIAQEIEANKVRSWPKPMDPNAPKESTVQTRWCDKCQGPHQLREDGTFKPRDYAVPDSAWGTPSWKHCPGPTQDPDVYVVHKGLVH